MKSCQKNCFSSSKAARDEVKRIRSINIFRSKKSTASRHGAKSNGKTKVYFCKQCESWHLTTMPANVSRIIKKHFRKNN